MKMNSNKLSPILVVFTAIVGLFSCKKENSMGFTPGKGAPTISSVHTLSKKLADTLVTQTHTYNSAGNDSVVIATNTTHQTNVAFDSTVVAGNQGDYYVIYGTNLGSATDVSFNGVSAYFNRALISDQSIVVAIPLNIPTFGTAATDTLSITTLYGTAKYKFTVLTPPPTIQTISDYDFWSGSQITFTGVGFASVSSVNLVDTTGATATCSIISQTDGQIVLKFPETTINRGHLVFSYTSNGNILKVTSTDEFVDVDNAYQIFAKNSLQNGWYDNSWTKATPDISAAATKTGTSSFVISYPAGAWQVEGFAASGGAVYSSDYKYLSFWVKGGSVDHTLNIVSDQATGWGQNSINPIVVPATVWSYYKIPLATLGLTGWTSGQNLTSIGFFLKGQSGDVDETYYFDDVILVK